jgi:hypothetical protein
MASAGRNFLPSRPGWKSPYEMIEKAPPRRA